MKKQLLYIIVFIVYRLLLDWIYSIEIAPEFGYALLVNEATSISMIWSWISFAIITFFTIPFLLDKHDYFISCIVLVLYLIRAVPFTSFVCFSPQSTLYLCINIFYWCFLFWLLAQKNITIRFKMKKSETIVSLFTFVSIAVVLIVSGVYAKFRLHLSLADVYDLREEARAFTVPTVLAYLHAATGNIVPVLMVYYITRNKKLLVLALGFIGLLNFSIAGQKATLFKIAFCIFLLVFKNIDLKKAIPFLLLILCGLVIGTYFYFDDSSLAFMVIRRVFYVPNMIDTLYYDYINAHSPLYFDSEASGQLAFDLSEIYLNRFESRANNGLFSDAYTNLGIIGVVVMPLLLSLFLKVFSDVTKGINSAIVSFSAIIIASTLTSAFLTRSLLTHGLFLLCLLFFFMPTDERNKVKIRTLGA